jgi:CubicO group peptidase (beta-lactamase class C family)
MIRRTVLALLAVILAACPVHAGKVTEERISRVEKGLIPPVLIKGGPEWEINERMEHYRVPGLSVAVIYDFRVSWAKGYGVKDVRTDEPVTAMTLFQAASISKPVNATAIMREVQDGRITLDGDVNTWLRSWKVPDNEFTARRKVTVADLLSHTGGTTVSGFPGYAEGAPLPTIQQILSGEPPANTPPVVVDMEPGRAFRYSGGGVTILQLLLTELEDKPYPQIMKEIVLGPLGMTSSTFDQPLPTRLRVLAATAHIRDREPVEGGYNVYPEMAAAGLWTTPTDLARFAIEHQLSLQSRSNLILSRESEEMMTTPHVSQGYGLGFAIRNRGGRVYFTHSGGNLGFNCLLIADKEAGYGAVIMANSSAGDLIEEIVRSIAREYSWDGYITGPYDLYSVSPDTLLRYAGRYLIDTDQVAYVSVEDGHLKADVTGEPPFDLYPISPDEFVRTDSEARIQFITGVDPGSDRVKIVGDGLGISFPRMGEDRKTPFEYMLSGDIDEGTGRYRELRDSDRSHRAITEQRLNGLGYQLLGRGLVREAIALFQLNVEFYPGSWNVYDSLGEAYLKNGDTELAVRNYTRSLELNPGNTNAAKALEEISNR